MYGCCVFQGFPFGQFCFRGSCGIGPSGGVRLDHTVAGLCHGQSVVGGLVAMFSLCWLLWSVSVGCYGQPLLVAMVSFCWLLWSFSVGCCGQSLLVAMVSLCCYGQSLLEFWLLWSVSVGCYGQSLL